MNNIYWIGYLGVDWICTDCKKTQSYEYGWGYVYEKDTYVLHCNNCWLSHNVIVERHIIPTNVPF